MTRDLEAKKKALAEAANSVDELALRAGLNKVVSGTEPTLAEQLAIQRAKTKKKRGTKPGTEPRSFERDTEMMRMRQQGKTYREIGEHFGVPTSVAHLAVTNAINRVYTEPAERYLASILEGLQVEITDSRNLLARLRSITENVDAEWLGSRQGLALVREITSASSVLERCLSTAARISGAEAPKKIEVALEVKKVVAFQDQMAAALTMALSRVLGRYHDVEATARIGHEILTELEAFQPPPPAVETVAEIIDEAAAEPAQTEGVPEP